MEAFTSYIEAKIETSRKTLEQSVDPVILHRQQGAIEAYRRMLRIRDEINASDKNG